MANYLYNGVRLPKLPEWDKSKYPYALIIHYPYNDGTSYSILNVFSKPFSAIDLTEKYGYVSVQVVEDGGTYLEWAFTSGTDTQWRTANSPVTSDTWESRTTKVQWTNTDILEPDGTLHLAASEPVPVTTAAPIDPTSLLMGYRGGQMIRGMRKQQKEDV